MSEYTPDTWVILRIRLGHPHYRVFAGWYGGFANGDSWKMNSGITRVIDKDTYYEIHGYSGSVYICNKHSEKMSGYMESVLASSRKKATEGQGIDVVEMKDFTLDLMP